MAAASPELPLKSVRRFNSKIAAIKRESLLGSTRFSNSNVSHSPPGLLYLCADVSSEIYEYMTPLDDPSAYFQGLFLSCRQIDVEVEIDCVRTIAQVMKDIKKNWAFDEDLMLDITKCYYNIKEITIRISQLHELDVVNFNVNLKAGPSENIRKHGSILTLLFSHYLSTMIIVFYRKDCRLTRSKELLPYIHYVLCRNVDVRKLLCAVSAPLCSRNTDCVVLEITSESQQALFSYMLIRYCASRPPLRMYGQYVCDEVTPYVLNAVQVFLHR